MRAALLIRSGADEAGVGSQRRAAPSALESPHDVVSIEASSLLTALQAASAALAPAPKPELGEESPLAQPSCACEQDPASSQQAIDVAAAFRDELAPCDLAAIASDSDASSSATQHEAHMQHTEQLTAFLTAVGERRPPPGSTSGAGEGFGASARLDGLIASLKRCKASLDLQWQQQATAGAEAAMAEAAAEVMSAGGLRVVGAASEMGDGPWAPGSDHGEPEDDAGAADEACATALADAEAADLHTEHVCALLGASISSSVSTLFGAGSWELREMAIDRMRAHLQAAHAGEPLTPYLRRAHAPHRPLPGTLGLVPAASDWRSWPLPPACPHPVVC